MKEKLNALDYGVQSPEKRIEIVNKILEQSDPEMLSAKFMEILSDYILFAMSKEEKKNRDILTPNREVTIRKRETSYEGLADKLENGEQGIHNLITNDKNIIFNHSIRITQDDIDNIPTMKELVESIQKLIKQYENATGERKNSLKRQIIQLSKDQYVLKSTFKKNFYFNRITKDISQSNSLHIDEVIYLNALGEVVTDSEISLIKPECVSSLLKQYVGLTIDNNESFNSDMKWLLDELNHLIDKLGKTSPMDKDLLMSKIKGMQNVEIQKFIYEKYGIKHSLEYISSLWIHGIPETISELKKEEWLIWYYKNHKTKDDWKTCSQCGISKPKHNKFYSKNKTSKDGLYSICKCCRNKR